MVMSSRPNRGRLLALPASVLMPSDAVMGDGDGYGMPSPLPFTHLERAKSPSILSR